MGAVFGMHIDIKYLNDKCKLVQGSNGAIAFDVKANIDEPITIECGKSAVIPLGFALDTKKRSIGMFLFIRSGLGCKHGLTILNSVGIIDSDYRGEVMAVVYNTGAMGKSFTIEPNMRCGQVVFLESVDVTLNEVAELNKTQRGAGGFGSTGVN